jgi:hypothetical protein
MKRVILLLLILIFSSITTIAYAEDVLIIHQGYANSHIKWKNRLEDAGHTVTSVQVGSNGSSFPSNTTSYEQIYDLINLPYHLVQDYSGGPAIETAYKALLARGGTLYLQMENPGCCVSRNTNIMDFIEDVGGGSLSYSSSYSSNSITQHNSNESWLSGFSGTVTFSLAGILTGIGNGTWFAKDGNGNIVGAVWYGSDLSSSYTGKIIVITDINYNSHSTYYTNNNKNWMNAMRAMLLSTYNSAVSISSAQSTKRTAAMNADRESGCNICIVQSGANPTINIQQDGNANFIVDEDWSGPATVTGDNLVLNIKQGNVTTTGSSDENGIGLYINGDNTNLTISQGDHANDQGEHKIVLDINGNSNVLNLTQYDGGTLSKHFFEGHIDSASNNFTITQKDNGQKTMFLDVNGNSNEGTFIQEDTGTHYLDVTLDADHEVDITQRGSGNHGARVDLDGYSTDFDLIQQGSTAQYYNLDNTCSNALGCTINTTQGTQ